MGQGKKGSPKKTIWIASALVAALVLAAGAFGLKTLLTDDGTKRKRQVQMVMILKPPPPPPPPPEIKEEPKEPEVKEEIKEPDEPDQMEDQAQDDTPVGEELGLDADGSAGSDAFGLKAKKGGRALIGGGLGANALMRQYAWYVQIVQDEIRKKVRERLDRNGGIPEGALKTYVKIVLDGRGAILKYDVYGPSGNKEMDDAVTAALSTIPRVSEPLPAGMDKASMKIKITSKG
jgi:outer membrane biosynthesis protein TonB